MSIEDLKALPVSQIADKDCALFLWITFPCLQEALELIRAWGFSYKTVAFVWVKQTGRRIPLLGDGLLDKGECGALHPRHERTPQTGKFRCASVVLSHIEEHSKKPEEVRDRIVRLMGDLPRIELFARQSPEGWDVWGNEVECSITLGKEASNGICTGPEGP